MFLLLLLLLLLWSRCTNTSSAWYYLGIDANVVGISTNSISSGMLATTSQFHLNYRHYYTTILDTTNYWLAV